MALVGTDNMGLSVGMRRKRNVKVHCGGHWLVSFMMLIQRKSELAVLTTVAFDRVLSSSTLPSHSVVFFHNPDKFRSVKQFRGGKALLRD